ncbi:glycerate kinase family protein [Streptomyces niger]|uniref:glycerate kinase family protein n=1 Tax=Streptomyces niger TaxID=66373 RepID=UPI00069BA687|nr:glycerate kinase [Streptomyces niger]
MFLRVLVAPSGFKESLSVEAVGAAISGGIRRVLPEACVAAVPLVDGGEGTARTLAAATGGRLVPVTVTGPTGAAVPSHIAVLGGGGPPTAVVEMAAAAGLALVPDDARDPGRTTTYGVGELIRAALDQRCRRIVVGCGDSGTCDGGAGALTALGARVLDADGRQVPVGGSGLLRAHTLELDGLDVRLTGTEIFVACNPYNLLTGEGGVARTFGPQKGATPAQVEELASAMDHWAALLERRCGTDVRLMPGGGASGGLGAGLAAALGARLLPRFDVLPGYAELDAQLALADLVITAEGALDHQTPRGKIPAEVARRAKRQGKQVIALAGIIGHGAAQTHPVGIDAYASILSGPMSHREAMDSTAALLSDAAEQALRMVLVGTRLSEPPLPVGDPLPPVTGSQPATTAG